MNKLEDLTMLYRVAKYYFEDDYSQNQIAKIESVSRSQISRLLKKARDIGIVTINISLPDNLNIGELCTKLKHLLKLKDVIISPSVKNEKDNTSIFYAKAATYLNETIGDYKNVGIGWGASLYQTALKLSYQPEHRSLTFYPLAGNSGSDNPYLQTSNITDRFSEKFGAKAYFTHQLIIALKSSFTDVELERLEHLANWWNHLDAAIIGIGGEIQSSNSYIDEFPSYLYKKLSSDDIMGDILGTYFLKNNTILKLPDSYRLISIDLNSLKRISNIICIACGKNKVESIIFAAQKGYIKTLITDTNTATLMLEALEK